MRPVLAVPLWLGVPLYLIYAAVWVALAVIAVAIGTAIVIGYGIFSLIRRQA